MKRLRSLLKSFRERPTIAADFDPVFYAAHHPDLQELRSAERLWAHYVEHGRREGRPPNLGEAIAEWERRFGPLPPAFDVTAYRLLNEDLARAYVHDHQFIRHFLEHGRQEGRPFLVDMPIGGTNGVPGGPWPALFRTPEFTAMAQDWLPSGAPSRTEALRIFVEQGIERLAPISFKHGFDPQFYRQTYELTEATDAAELYRTWLTEGVSAGRAPNETAFLEPYLGGRRYPADFAWQAYRAGLPPAESAGIANRAGALAHLFERGFETNRGVGNIAGFDLLAAIGDFQLRRGRLGLAARAYDQAEAYDAARFDGSLLYRRGKARQARSAGEALSDFRQAIARDDHPWDAVQAAIALLIDEKTFEEALRVLREQRERWNERADFLACVHRTLQAWFDHARASALELYALGRRKEADSLIEAALAGIEAALVVLDRLPPALPLPAEGAVVILANQELRQCRHYRVEQKLRQFEQAGLQAEAFEETQAEAFIAALAGAKAALFYRVTATPAVQRAILHARALGLPTYYEIDDLLFDGRYFPPDLATYEGQITPHEHLHLQLDVPLHRFAMRLCDTAIASTSALARHMRPLVRLGRSVVLPNGLDARNDAFLARGRQLQPADKPVTLFYGSGTKAHNLDFTRELAPVLLDLLRDYPQLRLVVAGHLRLGPEFAIHAGRITRVGFVEDIGEYWSVLQACDINLAVLSPGESADCKSEIKWLEAAACAIPSVVSATATYREALSHGVDGFLAETGEDWRDCLKALIDSPELRLDMGNQAREKAWQRYALGRGAAILAETFAPAECESISPSSSSSSPLKILVCNVFFAPQSHGGATRVVEDNVDHFIDHCPDIEVSVFASDERRQPYETLSCDSYRDRPVFRISARPNPLRDWQPFNPNHGRLFRRVLDRVRPDIVHFHCIQRLGASIVEATEQAGIPYLVTLHDGWWISDSQFFIDRDGILRLPDQNPFNICPVEGVSLSQSVARRQALAALLGKAAAVLAVSQPFAALHRGAGIAAADVLENGVPALELHPHRPRTDGRLALGHLGGRSIQKGAILVEAALRKGRFERLALTMIDHALAPDEHLSTCWGATPVLLRGPCPPSKVEALYAELDAVLAPSVWPESFGLVAREAASLGLRVVASDRGAIGECIRLPEQGAVIDVSSDAALAEILGAMNANPEAWRAGSLPPQGLLRRAADQGRELADLYRAIAAR
ncbi:glycosyltransferase [Labrys sp. ZIDIC5]|uniref:glycosyltransferase n=1 Tax=Labrys sedimenti TaxID=3106036 RepID=UPI002ACADE00|nr:glycosyltransferase [Labrys sp. ZIDIC5]MDZ5453558.1 glycosyltransferase [Labrys sp. ZIDIC5]